MKTNLFCLLLTLSLSCLYECSAYVSPLLPHKLSTGRRLPTTFAAPSRLADNAEGVLYVNEKCISCSACAMFAPETFGYSPNHQKFVVKKQPNDKEQPQQPHILENARAALSACPVAAIRVENSAKLNHNKKEKLSESDAALAKSLAINAKANGLALPFPRPVPGLEGRNVWHTGYHNSGSFGGVPYLAKGVKTGVAVMVDVPKFSPASVRAVQSLTGEDGPDYMFLTHVDDTADHGKWRERFPSLKRIFHAGDLGKENWVGDTTLENVEVLLRDRDEDLEDATGFQAWTLDGTKVELDLTSGSWPDVDSDFIIVHTPGHSKGSITLLFHAMSDDATDSSSRNVIFTGDTYAYSIREEAMSGFPRYGRDLNQQSQTLRKLLKLTNWDFVAPGHGCYKDYSTVSQHERDAELEGAVERLLKY